MMEISKSAERALEPDEIVKWVGKPGRLHVFYKWFFGFFFVAMGVGLLNVVLTGEGIRNSESGKISTPQESIAGILFGMAFLGGFYFLWKRQYDNTRYVITNKRAFNTRTIWGGSWSFSFRAKKMERDYTDPEYSPISGGYFTPDTSVERTGSDDFGNLKIVNMRSEMDDAQTISKIKSLFPTLNGIIYDPANLTFAEVANPKMAEMEIKAVLNSYKSKLNPEPSHE